NRLVDLQRRFGFSYLMISHNVAAVRFVADRVAVMYLGKIAEAGPVRGVLERPLHPYTKALLAALPVPDARRRAMRYRVSGEVPSLINPPPGCRFAGRRLHVYSVFMIIVNGRPLPMGLNTTPRRRGL